MTQRDWNAHYASNELPWDTGEPEPRLVELVQQGTAKPGRVLEIGCGTGTNALWLATQGFDVTALDLAPLAIERARTKAANSAITRCTFKVHDFLAGEPLQESYDLVFDRGCFHVFSEAQQQADFAARVAAVLSPDGLWLSLIGSTEGAPREMGPPRRNAREVLAALEPSLALVSLCATEFSPLVAGEEPPKSWSCLSRRRDMPAQPSSRW